MNRIILDEKLRKLNKFEEELKNLNGLDVKLHFSRNAKNHVWETNSDKLMNENDEIAIHKHDRFIEFEKHKHDYIEMMFVYSGKIVHRFGDEAIRLAKGEILLLDMNVEHSIQPAAEEDIAINILIKKKFFDTFFLKQIAYNNIITDFVIRAIYSQTKKQSYMYFQSGDNDKIYNYLLELLSEFYEKSNGYETAIRAYMLLVFNELFRGYEKHLTKPLVKKIDKAIELDIRHYIDQNYKTVSLKSMAEYFNYNSDYLGKQIKKITGMNLRDLVKEKKLEEATRLLKHTDMTILEILDEINYSNASYFYKQFKQKYNITPDEYRKV